MVAFYQRVEFAVNIRERRFDNYICIGLTKLIERRPRHEREAKRETLGRCLARIP